MKADWKIKPLGEACEFSNGQAHEKCIDDTGKFKLINSKFVSSEGQHFKRTNNALSPLYENDIAIVMSDVPNGKTLAKCFLVDKNDTYTLNQRIGVIRSNNFDTRFLYYQLNRNKHFLSFNNGENQTNLRKADILNCVLLLPPLAEQKRIVTILDEAFEGIATATANAKKNLANARELFDGYLQTVFSRGGQMWQKKRLGDIVTRLTNGYVGPTRNIYIELGVPYLLARHVKNNQLTFDGKTFISDSFNQKNKKSILKIGDVLLVQSGHIGHSAVVTKEHEGHNCHAMIVMTPILKMLTGDFLSLYFSSSEMRQKFKEIRSGSTVPHLTCGEVRELKIGLPELRAQQMVVEHAAEMKTEIHRLETIYQQKLTALEELKKSILNQAFSGQLN